jgi:hypothetical protein
MHRRLLFKTNKQKTKTNCFHSEGVRIYYAFAVGIMMYFFEFRGNPSLRLLDLNLESSCENAAVLPAPIRNKDFSRSNLLPKLDCIPKLVTFPPLIEQLSSFVN